MVAIGKSSDLKIASSGSSDKFLAMLPEIQTQAHFAFRGLPAEAREELVQDVVAMSYGLFVSLCQRGKRAVAYPTPLAQYSIGKVRAGRRLGTRRNTRDVSSSSFRASGGVAVERLDRFDRRAGAWNEILIEDRTAGPDQIAAIRLDFAAWLQTLPARDRQLAETLAAGETTSAVGRMFKISAGRVSQLRRDLCENWREFVGEVVDASAPSVATA